jgi:hypothetical protein
MSLSDAASIILSAYTSLKTTYDQLRDNESAVRNLLEEILRYEPLIHKYADRIRALGSDESPPYAQSIKTFQDGIVGIQEVLIDYSESKKGRVQRVLNFCINWFSAGDNAAKIKKYSENISRAVAELNFGGTIMGLETQETILKHLNEISDKISTEQAEMLNVLNKVYADSARC